MKPKYAILLVGASAVLVFGLWWITRPTNVTADKTEPMPTAAKIDASKPTVPTTIAPALASTAPKPNAIPVAAAQPSTDTPTVSADPQADLKTAIPDIERLMRVGDLASLKEAYTPPDKVDPQQIQQMRERQQQRDANVAQNPKLQQVLQTTNVQMAQIFEKMENQTPVFNDAGDEATYIFDDPAAPEQRHLVFTKINGRWYIKPDAVSAP